MSSHETRYLQTFDALFSPAKDALAEIAGSSLSARQMHAVLGVVHALADAAAIQATRRRS